MVPTLGVITAGAIAAILLLLVVDAALRGPWLDEFWTQELADARKGLVPLIRDGWLSDTHPPLFNAWATLLSSLGVTTIPAGRIASNLLGVGLMIFAALRFARRQPEQAAFNAALLLLTLSLPQAMEAFVTYRSYFWQIAAIATLTLVARHVATTRSDLDYRQDGDLAFVAIVATAASIGLHYVGGLFGGLLAGAIACHAYVRGRRRWAALIVATAIVSGLFMLALVFVQAPIWAANLDHSWIDTPLLAALGVPLTLVVTALWHNPVSFAGLMMGRLAGSPERQFLVIVAGPLVAGVGLVLVVHAFRPIIVDRYLFAVPVLVSALLAVPASRLAKDRRLFSLLALVSLVAVAVTVVDTGIRPLWRENARTIGRIVERCPMTQVYAASGWALGPAAETRAARREDPVFERAYRALGDENGYAVTFIGQHGSARARLGPCPVLLWVEHTPNEAENDLPAALDGAGLAGLEEASLSVIRTPTGLVIRAEQ